MKDNRTNLTSITLHHKVHIMLVREVAEAGRKFMKYSIGIELVQDGYSTLQCQIFIAH